MIDQIRLDPDQRVVSTNGKDMDTEVREYADALGVELYGIASADDYATHFPDKPQPSRFIENARSIIVIGLPYEPGTMTTVLRPELSGLRTRASDHVSSGGAQPLGAESFFMAEESEILKRELSWIGYKIAKFLRVHGWSSLHLPPSKQDARFRTAPFYHMPAMYLAGMGNLGLNCCILTPEFGPRVRVTSIITDCPLTAGEPLEYEVCDRCELCVENCPSGAIDGVGWKNPFACASYGCCGTCVAICPHGAA